jgi:hypothetical protein
MKQGNNDCTHALMQQVAFVYCVLWVQHIHLVPSSCLLLPLLLLCCIAGDPCRPFRQQDRRCTITNPMKQ